MFDNIDHVSYSCADELIISCSLGHTSCLTPTQTPWSILFFLNFTLQNKAYPDFDKARDWLILFFP